MNSFSYSDRFYFPPFICMHMRLAGLSQHLAVACLVGSKERSASEGRAQQHRCLNFLQIRNHMKFNKTLLVAIVGMSITSSVNAVQLNITGAISAPACTITAAGGSISVPMGTLDSNAFGTPPTPGTHVGTKLVRLPLTCTKASDVSIRVTGTNDGDDRRLLKINQGSGAAVGVGVGFYDNTGTLIQMGTDAPQMKVTAGATPEFTFSVAYVATKTAITQGTANATAQVDIVTY